MVPTEELVREMMAAFDAEGLPWPRGKARSGVSRRDGRRRARVGGHHRGVGVQV